MKKNDQISLGPRTFLKLLYWKYFFENNMKKTSGHPVETLLFFSMTCLIYNADLKITTNMFEKIFLKYFFEKIKFFHGVERILDWCF